MVNLVLLIGVILLPALSAALCYTVRSSAFRRVVVVLTTIAMFIVAGMFVNVMMTSGGTIIFKEKDIHGEILGWAIKLLDLLLLVYIMYTGFRLKKFLIVGLTLVQLIPLALLESGLLGHVKEPEIAFSIDFLSLVMILLISVIGPVITVFAIGYMKEHEHHMHLKKSRQPRFFMILFAFLGAMNALVMTDNLLWMYFFWEVTTLCSFLLISHDGNEQAVKNATRALWINLLGGVAFMGAIMIFGLQDMLSVTKILETKAAGEFTGLIPIALGLLCFAGFTKSAMFPFQSWLLGAMVAPTPVSALLHSSTMVKAGVYLVVRMSPAFAGTILGKVVAIVGAFTFLAGSAIAISQRNAKRVLAYSTIANLGLIIGCAGIGTHIALGAAVLLIIFHAVSKGLLFLCVGTIEHGIGSRDIEDMQGLMKRMPYTTVITVIGMISMMLPPFGVLITKWLAIEASVNSPIVLVFIILGSAFTVVFWAKWIGIILTMSYKPKYEVESLPFSVKSSLGFLLVSVIASSVFIVPLFQKIIQPYLAGISFVQKEMLVGNTFGIQIAGMNNAVMGGFASILFFVVVFAVMITIPVFLRRTTPEKLRLPYLCGENVNDDIRGIEFMSPGDKVESVIVQNYYLSGLFGENKLTLWMNLISGAILIIMFGVVIK